LKKITFYIYIEVEFNSSVTQTPWFWPLIGVCLALLVSIPCSLITIVMFCHNKNQSDDSRQSSMSSDSSTPVQRRHYPRSRRSYYAGAFRSPPPPYTTSEQPENVFVSSSFPPPYESDAVEDESARVTSPSLQTCEV
jgi:hypothetical protein